MQRQLSLQEQASEATMESFVVQQFSGSSGHHTGAWYFQAATTSRVSKFSTLAPVMSRIKTRSVELLLCAATKASTRYTKERT